jgi:hypothetical protein
MHGASEDIFMESPYNLRMQVAAIMLKQDGYLPPDELAEVLRENGDRPIPASVQDYMADLAAGKSHKLRGRPSLQGDERDDLIVYLYDRYCVWLKKREKRRGNIPGWLKRCDFWQGSPADRAARIVAALIARKSNFMPVNFSSVPNIVSKTKKRYETEKAKGTYQLYWRSYIDRWNQSHGKSQSQQIG